MVQGLNIPNLQLAGTDVERNELGKSVADLEYVLAQAKERMQHLRGRPDTTRQMASFRARTFEKAQKTLRQLSRAPQTEQVVMWRQKIQFLLDDMRVGQQ